MNKIGISLLLILILFGCTFTTQVPKSDFVVVITFDDNYLNVYNNVLPIMEQYGFRGTMFTNTGMVGRPKRLSWPQLDSLKHFYNWEIGGHTLHHEMLTQLSYQEAEANIAQDYQNLVERDYKPKSFATTYGYCPAEYYAMLKKYYKNVRTCINTPMYVPVDRNLLGAYNVDNSMSATNIVSRITQGINEKQNLVILLFHEASTTDTDYFNNCHPDVFAETMKKLHKMEVKVLPLDEALDFLSD